MEALNLATLPKYLSNEASAWELLERLRWPDGEPVCPHCGTKDAKHYFIAAKSGERKTKAGNVTYRRLWRCRGKACRKQFSVMVGTIFESSKIPASKWLLAMWLMGAGKNSISALELQRHLGISYQTAWFLGHRLREAMQREPVFSLLSARWLWTRPSWAVPQRTATSRSTVDLSATTRAVGPAPHQLLGSDQELPQASLPQAPEEAAASHPHSSGMGLGGGPVPSEAAVERSESRLVLWGYSTGSWRCLCGPS